MPKHTKTVKSSWIAICSLSKAILSSIVWAILLRCKIQKAQKKPQSQHLLWQDLSSTFHQMVEMIQFYRSNAIHLNWKSLYGIPIFSEIFDLFAAKHYLPRWIRLQANMTNQMLQNWSWNVANGDERYMKWETKSCYVSASHLILLIRTMLIESCFFHSAPKKSDGHERNVQLARPSANHRKSIFIRHVSICSRNMWTAIFNFKNGFRFDFRLHKDNVVHDKPNLWVSWKHTRILLTSLNALSAQNLNASNSSNSHTTMCFFLATIDAEQSIT